VCNKFNYHFAGPTGGAENCKPARPPKFQERSPLLRIYLSSTYLSIFTPNTPNLLFVSLKALVLLAFGVGGQQPQRAPNAPDVEARRRHRQAMFAAGRGT
jgi:hypothetical protein